MAESGYDFDSSQDEVLDAGARHRMPPWLVGPILFLMLLAGFVVAINRQDSPAPSPPPLPSSPAPSAAPSTRVPFAPLPPNVTGLVPARGRRGYYILFNGRLEALDYRGETRVVGPRLETDESLDVVTDGVRHVWVYPGGGTRPGTLMMFDAVTLRRRFEVALPQVVEHTAIIGGVLYLVTRPGDVLRARRDGSGFARVAHLDDWVVDAVADPSRSRLLVTTFGGTFAVATVPLDGAPAVRAPAPFTGGRLLVTDDAIWAGGSGGSGAVLTRLDPATLRAGRNVAVARRLGPEIALAATGVGVLFVRREPGPALYCLDARSGEVLERWSRLPGLVASTASGIAIVAPSGEVPRPITLGGCRVGAS